MLSGKERKEKGREAWREEGKEKDFFSSAFTPQMLPAAKQGPD